MAQDASDADAFWRGVEITPERRRIIEDSMLSGAAANMLAQRMNAVLGDPPMFTPLDRDACLRLVAALDAYIADPTQAPRAQPDIRAMYEVLDAYPQVHVRLDGMSIDDARAQVISDLRRDRQHFAERCESG